MHATLTFNLPEDQETFKHHCDVYNYRRIINEFRQYLRNNDKSGLNPDFNAVTEKFNDLLAEFSFD